METNKNIWVKTNSQGMNENKEVMNKNDSEVQPCCGRTYNEDASFNQSNFAAYQDILNKRNEMLSGVKVTYNI